MADQGAIRQPDITANTHQGRVGDIAAATDMDMIADRVKSSPAAQVDAPLAGIRVAQLLVERAATPG
ncbi:hypothetical protein D3C81_2216520 [compost metagenome]